MGEALSVTMVSVVILFGPPGAGKGTQAMRLAAARRLPHVSTGDLFRMHREKRSPLGLQATEYMDRGELVPDDLVLDMLFHRVREPDCARGYLLDGFPRTLSQARALEKRFCEGDHVTVLSLAVKDGAILERLTGRLTCSGCGAIYHVRTKPPKEPGRCDACGSALAQRKDDTPEVVNERLRVFHDQTEPLVRYYAERGVLRTIDGEGSPETVFAALDDAIGRQA